jgi:hypothetical protein
MTAESRKEGTKEMFKRLDVWCKIALMALLVLLFAIARSYPSESRQFPQLIAVFTFIMLTISLVRDLFGIKTKAPPKSAETGDDGFQAADREKGLTEKKKRLYLTWGMILVSTGIGFGGGFLITTFLIFIGFALFFGDRKHLLRNSLTAIAVTAVIYFVFEWIMRVPLLGN